MLALKIENARTQNKKQRQFFICLRNRVEELKAAITAAVTSIIKKYRCTYGKFCNLFIQMLLDLQNSREKKKLSFCICVVILKPVP
jgi:hypothetical protein